MSTFYDFFAGGGMARMGLGPEWQCLFANDWNEKKGRAYVENWGTSDFKLGDINNIQLSELPGRADLVWSSFPCQDLSLAGKEAGLKGKRSGVFWSFWKRMLDLAAEERKPKIRQAVRDGRKAVGAIYKRMRPDGQGERVQRAEVQFDDTAGCLRTPSGGSSRQIIMLIEKGIIRTRLLSPREAARLMGLPDDYKPPER